MGAPTDQLEALRGLARQLLAELDAVEQRWDDDEAALPDVAATLDAATRKWHGMPPRAHRRGPTRSRSPFISYEERMRRDDEARRADIEHALRHQRPESQPAATRRPFESSEERMRRDDENRRAHIEAMMKRTRPEPPPAPTDGRWTNMPPRPPTRVAETATPPRPQPLRTTRQWLIRAPGDEDDGAG